MITIGKVVFFILLVYSLVDAEVNCSSSQLSNAGSVVKFRTDANSVSSVSGSALPFDMSRHAAKMAVGAVVVKVEEEDYHCMCVFVPSSSPTSYPNTAEPTFVPSTSPTAVPSVVTTALPSLSPSSEPSRVPSNSPTCGTITEPTRAPTEQSKVPTWSPSAIPTANPTTSPTYQPSVLVTAVPSHNPTYSPSASKSSAPTVPPSLSSTTVSTVAPTYLSTTAPSTAPTASSFNSMAPSASVTKLPTAFPSSSTTIAPTVAPSIVSSTLPTVKPTVTTSTTAPTLIPTATNTLAPSATTSAAPSISSTAPPSLNPTLTVTFVPSISPTDVPALTPSLQPSTAMPTFEPTAGANFFVNFLVTIAIDPLSSSSPLFGTEEFLAALWLMIEGSAMGNNYRGYRVSGGIIDISSAPGNISDWLLGQNFSSTRSPLLTSTSRRSLSLSESPNRVKVTEEIALDESTGSVVTFRVKLPGRYTASSPQLTPSARASEERSAAEAVFLLVAQHLRSDQADGALMQQLLSYMGVSELPTQQRQLRRSLQQPKKMSSALLDATTSVTALVISDVDYSLRFNNGSTSTTTTSKDSPSSIWESKAFLSGLVLGGFAFLVLVTYGGKRSLDAYHKSRQEKDKEKKAKDELMKVSHQMEAGEPDDASGAGTGSIREGLEGLAGASFSSLGAGGSFSTSAGIFGEDEESKEDTEMDGSLYDDVEQQQHKRSKGSVSFGDHQLIRDDDETVSAEDRAAAKRKLRHNMRTAIASFHRHIERLQSPSSASSVRTTSTAHISQFMDPMRGSYDSAGDSSTVVHRFDGSYVSCSGVQRDDDDEDREARRVKKAHRSRGSANGLDIADEEGDREGDDLLRQLRGSGCVSRSLSRSFEDDRQWTLHHPERTSSLRYLHDSRRQSDAYFWRATQDVSDVQESKDEDFFMSLAAASADLETITTCYTASASEDRDDDAVRHPAMTASMMNSQDESVNTVDLCVDSHSRAPDTASDLQTSQLLVHTTAPLVDISGSELASTTSVSTAKEVDPTTMTKKKPKRKTQDPEYFSVNYLVRHLRSQLYPYQLTGSDGTVLVPGETTFTATVEHPASSIAPEAVAHVVDESSNTSSTCSYNSDSSDSASMACDAAQSNDQEDRCLAADDSPNSILSSCNNLSHPLKGTPAAPPGIAASEDDALDEGRGSGAATPVLHPWQSFRSIRDQLAARPLPPLPTLEEASDVEETL